MPGQYSVGPVVGGVGGTVTSIGISVPSILSVANSPVTTSGTIALSLSVQNANKVFAGPATGADAAPTFRALVDADIANAIVIGKVLTGFVSGAGAVGATDSILSAIDKLDGNIALKQNAAYTPANGADWADADPTTIVAAIDRLAAAVAGLLGNPIP